MNFSQQELLAYVHSNGSHECGHITVLFKAGRFRGLNFLPHEVAANGFKGVLETDAGVPLGREDCVALAAGMIGELVCIGAYDSERLLDDRRQVQQLVGQTVENFAREAYDVIRQNLLFFTLLNIEVRKKMLAVLSYAYSLSEEDHEKLSQ